MKLRKITPSLSVSDQLTEQDLEIAAAQGFRSIINNRPDGETEDQPRSEVLWSVAERLGLAYRHIPVVPGNVTDDNVSAFVKAMSEMREPVLAFCRTGTRSTTLWALAEAWRLDSESILTTAAAVGYDLAELRPRLEERNRTVRAS